MKIYRIYRKLDTRKDFLHRLSTKVVRENQSIILEDLNVSGMVKNRKLSRAISLQDWREFRVWCEARVLTPNTPANRSFNADSVGFNQRGRFV